MIKIRIVVCPSCKKKNKIGGRLKGRTCKHCGAPLDDASQVSQSQASQAETPKSRKDLRKQAELDQKEKYSGDFRQFGVICLDCRTINPFGKKKMKRCITCNNKLKVGPRTIIYYNGQVESVQCPKCGAYTDYKLPKCEHCGKKLKI